MAGLFSSYGRISIHVGVLALGNVSLFFLRPREYPMYRHLLWERPSVTDTRPIAFVGGLHRSGTTLLADVLARHSRLGGHVNDGFAANEGQHTQDVLPTDEDFHGPGRFAFYPRYREVMNADTFADAERRLRNAWNKYWPDDAGCVVEKTPGNILRAVLLKNIFPAANFIFLIRHPVAVSLATQKWSHTSIFSLFAHWLAAHDNLLAYEQQKIDHLVVFYEDFLQRPEAIVAACFEHIGVPAEPIPLPRLNNANEEYFARWRTHFISNREITAEYFISKERVESTSTTLFRAVLRQAKKLEHGLLSMGFQIVIADREARDASEVFGERIGLFGYSLVDLNLFPRSYVFRPGIGRMPIP